MKLQLTLNTLYEEILRTAVSVLDNAADALICMTLLHTHQIRLYEPLVSDAPGITLFPAITQRQAATIISNLWYPRQGQEIQPEYWYHLWNEQHAYEVVEDIPSEVYRRMLQMRALLAKDCRILAIEPEM